MATSQVQQLRGFALPAIRTAGGYFGSKGADDVAWSALILSIFTPVGSRPMRRQFGSALHEMVMEPADSDLQVAIDYVVREAAKQWAPHVVVKGVQTRVDGTVVGVLIEFSRSDDKARTMRSPMIRVSKSDVINLLATGRNS